MSNNLYMNVSGVELAEIVSRVEDAIQGESVVGASLACLIVAILCQRPEVEPQKLHDLVKDTSAFIAASLNGAQN